MPQRIELDREQSQRQQDGLSSSLHEMVRMCEEAWRHAMSSLDISKQFIEQTIQRQEAVEFEVRQIGEQTRQQKQWIAANFESHMAETRGMREQARLTQQSMTTVESELAELRRRGERGLEASAGCTELMRALEKNMQLVARELAESKRASSELINSLENKFARMIDRGMQEVRIALHEQTTRKEKTSGWAGGDTVATIERSGRASSAAGLAAEPRIGSHITEEMSFYPDSERAGRATPSASNDTNVIDVEFLSRPGTIVPSAMSPSPTTAMLAGKQGAAVSAGASLGQNHTEPGVNLPLGRQPSVFADESPTSSIDRLPVLTAFVEERELSASGSRGVQVAATPNAYYT